jgi:hypothetical protein
LTQEDILEQLFEDARFIWPDFQTSQVQMDPVIHMIFRAMSYRLKETNDRINGISFAIIRDLACRIFFDGLLHPVPASTVLKFIAGNSATQVDSQTESYWVNTTQRQSATYYFAPTGNRPIYPYEAVMALSKTSDMSEFLWASPSYKEGIKAQTFFDKSRAQDSLNEKDQLFIALKPNGPDKAISGSRIFIMAGSELLGNLRWARWRFTEKSGVLGDPVIPGQLHLEKLKERKPQILESIWGYGQFAEEHENEYSNYFFENREGICGPIPAEIRAAFAGQEESFWAGLDNLYWIKIEFDKRPPIEIFKSFEYAATNAVVAINSHSQKQSFYYHGPGEMEIELPAPAGEIFEITAIEDNRGRFYKNIYSQAEGSDNECRFIPRIDGNSLKVLVSPPQRGSLPDRFIISMRVSNGAAANGIGASLINALYTPSPGIETVFNLTETRGGVFANSFDDMIATFPMVLRSRNRAIVAADFESLALSFDNRVKSAVAKLGSTSRYGAMSRCIDLELNLDGFKFNPEAEKMLFLSRLERHLQSRSPMGTIVIARIVN